MSSDCAIQVQGLGKCYHIYESPRDRLRQMFLRRGKQLYRQFWALKDVSFELGRGETLGVIGCNGAGKSTLLQLICGTLNPTGGTLAVHGRVAALLELGAGFNPEFTGRENVYLNASVLGLTKEEIDGRYEGIVAFSGIGDFIHQPVKTYSSGMFVRLAFSVAASVDPDILVIDEALSVGDGEFSRKSFDRIMKLKERGATILFCSHSMYQVEAFCERAIWLDQGQVRMLDTAQKVAAAYQATLDAKVVETTEVTPETISTLQQNKGKILNCYTRVDGNIGVSPLRLTSLKSRLEVIVEFMQDPSLPPSSVVLGIANTAGITITSVSSVDDGVRLSIDANGQGRATVVFPALPLRKGDYSITAILTCEHALHVYDMRERCITLQMTQQGPGQGFVELPHRWDIPAA